MRYNRSRVKRFFSDKLAEGPSPGRIPIQRDRWIPVEEYYKAYKERAETRMSLFDQLSKPIRDFINESEHSGVVMNDILDMKECGISVKDINRHMSDMLEEMDVEDYDEDEE